MGLEGKIALVTGASAGIGEATAIALADAGAKVVNSARRGEQHKVRVSTIKPAIVESEFQQVAGYTAENFGKSVQRFGQLLKPKDVAQAIVFVVSQPPHVNINDLMIRPVGQDYP